MSEMSDNTRITRGRHRSTPARAMAGAAAIALAGLLTLPASSQSGGQPPTPVRVDSVRQETVQQRRKVTGNLRSLARSRVASLEAGRVLELPVDEGDMVEGGQTLARLDDRRLSIQREQIAAELASQQAIVREREAQVELRQRDVNTLQELADRNAVNPKELNDARSELQVAIARRDQAMREVEMTHAALDLLDERLEDTVIRAPFAGAVVARLSELGQWIAEGDAIVELVTTGMFEAWLDVPQSIAEPVTARDVSITVKVEAVGRTYESTNIRVIRDIDALARTFPLVVRLPDEEAILSPGMSVVAWVPTTATAPQLTVHKDAVLRNDVGPFVYVVRDSGQDQPPTAIPVQIEVLYSLRERMVVEGALREGDRVIVEGNERLRPMTPVQPTDSDIVAAGSGDA